MWDAVAVCVRLWLWEAVDVGGFCGFGSSGLKKPVGSGPRSLVPKKKRVSGKHGAYDRSSSSSVLKRKLHKSIKAQEWC